MNNFSGGIVRNFHKLLFPLVLVTVLATTLPLTIKAQSTVIGRKAYGQKSKLKKRAALPPVAKTALPKRKSATVITNGQSDLPDGTAKKTARAAPRRALRRRARTTTAKNAAANADLVDATFVTSSGKSEIWLNDKLIGITDNNAYLTKKLKLGEYTVSVKKNNKEVDKPAIISVSAEKYKFFLFGEAFVR